jgi:hypothetical protein
MSDTTLDESASVSKHHSVVGFAVTDVSTFVGAIVWLLGVLTGKIDGIAALALALASLVLVPLGMGMAATPAFAGTARRLYDVAVLAQPVGAVFVFVALMLPSGSTGARLATIPWLFITGLLALTALARAGNRGLWPLSETVIDAGLAYALVGAVAFVLYEFGLTLWFKPVIILLTAVHFHYAGFVLQLFTGLVGRVLGQRAGRGFHALTALVLVGPALIAVGISFSPMVEVLAVSAFTVGVAVLAGYVVVQIVPMRPRIQGTLLTLSALALPVSMALALGYGLGIYTGFDPLGLDISTMTTIHGTLNAFGFAVIGMVGWRVAVPLHPTKPF